VPNNRVAECHGKEGRENDRVDDAMQCQALKIFQPKKLRTVNDSGAIQHLEEAMVNAKDQKDHREDDLDQKHSP